MLLIFTENENHESYSPRCVLSDENGSFCFNLSRVKREKVLECLHISCYE
jgi:hypothetical protein